MEEQGRPRHGSPTFYSLLEEMADTHDKKSHDYASDESPYGNYHFAGFVSSLFAHSPDDAGFAGRLADKIFRLAVLGKRRAEPKNESIADTERDIAVIASLWMASRRDRVRMRERLDATPTQDMASSQMQATIMACAESLSPIELQELVEYLTRLRYDRLADRDVLKSKETKKI